MQNDRYAPFAGVAAARLPAMPRCSIQALCGAAAWHLWRCPFTEGANATV